MVSYIDASAQALSLSLVRGSPGLVELDPIKETELSLSLKNQMARVKFGILGSSHFATVRVGEEEITEIFACHKAQGEWDLLFDGPLGQKGQLGLLEHNGTTLQYGFKAWTEQWCPSCKACVMNIADAIETSAILHGIPMGLSFEFPNSGDEQTDQSPVTLVLLSVTALKIGIRTVHSYPNEGLVVHTLSHVS